MDEFHKGACLPLVQSLITAALVFAIVVGVAKWLHWRDPWLLALTAGAVCGLSWWYGVIWDWRREAFFLQPPAPVPDQATSGTLRIQVHDRVQTTLLELPATYEQLLALASGLLAGQPFTEAVWTGAHGIFSKREFSQVRGEFLKRGWAVWNNPGSHSQGMSLTTLGRAVCEGRWQYETE